MSFDTNHLALSDVTVHGTVLARLQLLYIDSRLGFFKIVTSGSGEVRVHRIFEGMAILFDDGSFVNTRGDCMQRLDFELGSTIHCGVSLRKLTIETLRFLINREIDVYPIRYVTLTRETSVDLLSVVEGKGTVYTPVPFASYNLTLAFFTTSTKTAKYAHDVEDLKDTFSDMFEDGDVLTSFGLCDAR